MPHLILFPSTKHLGWRPRLSETSTYFRSGISPHPSQMGEKQVNDRGDIPNLAIPEFLYFLELG
jgi:hypothetical protein